MAVSKPTFEISYLKNDLLNYLIKFKNLKKHSELLLFRLIIFSFLV